jgi:hypothetical protein
MTLSDTAAPEAPTGFTVTEQLTVETADAERSLRRNFYEALGWTIDPDRPARRGSLALVRDRRIAERAELARLQLAGERSLERIARLRRSAVTTARIVSYTVGLVATALVGGAVFLYLADGVTPWFVVLSVLGVAVAAVPPLVHAPIVARRTASTNPVVDREYDSLYDVVQAATALREAPTPGAATR